jgi:hypothetical protein
MSSVHAWVKAHPGAGYMGPRRGDAPTALASLGRLGWDIEGETG